MKHHTKEKREREGGKEKDSQNWALVSCSGLSDSDLAGWTRPAEAPLLSIP
jgi:hypothetical protein